MKRLHVHISVENLQDSVRFYSAVFAAEPSVLHPDYAKWMLDDPRVNFAISQRGSKVGLDHLGIQVDNEADLATMKAQAQSADLALIDEGDTTCCYARSDKHWVVDPQGLPWEHFRTLGTIPTFRDSPELVQEAATPPAADASPCCIPLPRAKGSPIPIKQTGSGCC